MGLRGKTTNLPLNILPMGVNGMNTDIETGGVSFSAFEGY